MGARVALEMARQAPDRIVRLALLDTGIHPLRDGETEKRAEIVEYAHRNGMAALAERWLPGMVYEENRKNAELMRGLTDMVLRMDADLHARQIKALVNRPDASSYLSEIRCPVLLVVGRQDQWSPVSQHEQMLRLLPDARLEVIEEAGHFAPVEQPGTVARLVADFLKG
jgi:pimeloyl-ACP methyl ester carboxylesterase